MFLGPEECAATSTRGAAAVAPDVMLAPCIGNRFIRTPEDTPTDAQDPPADVRGRTGPFGTRRVAENAPPFSRRHGKSNFSQRLETRSGNWTEIGKRTRNEPCNRKLRKLGSDEDADSLRNFVVLMNRRHVRRCGAGDGRGNDEDFHRGSSRDERPVATTPVVNSYTAAFLLLRTNEKEPSTAPAPAPVARVDSASPSLHAVTEI